MTARAVSQVWPPLEERAEEQVTEAAFGVGHDQPPRPRAEGAIVLPGGRALGFAEYGPADGDPILWFHGTPGARQQVPPDIDEQATARGFRVVGIERPGTGLSTPHGYGRIVDWAADVEAVVDRLGIDRFAAVGLSGGGPYVLAVCHELPDRVVAGAVLGGMGPTRGPEAAPGVMRLLAPIEPLLSFVRIPVGEAISHAVRPICRFGPPIFDLYARVAPASDRAAMKVPELKAMFLHDIISAAQGGLRALANDVVLFARDWGFSLRDIQVPVKFWNGDADGIVPLSHGETQCDLIPDAELVVCPGGGHFAGFLLAPDVLSWIGDTWPDRIHADQTHHAPPT
jgi:pimeloyl-ACP methyl ester carboxylesterase